MDFAVDAQLAHAARDQLGVLGAEIQNQDLVVTGLHAVLGLTFDPIIRGFLDDGYIVDMRLTHTRAGDAYKGGLGAQ